MLFIFSTCIFNLFFIDNRLLVVSFYCCNCCIVVVIWTQPTTVKRTRHRPFALWTSLDGCQDSINSFSVRSIFTTTKNRQIAIRIRTASVGWTLNRSVRCVNRFCFRRLQMHLLIHVIRSSIFSLVALVIFSVRRFLSSAISFAIVNTINWYFHSGRLSVSVWSHRWLHLIMLRGFLFTILICFRLHGHVLSGHVVLSIAARRLFEGEKTHLLSNWFENSLSKLRCGHQFRLIIASFSW